MVSDEDREAVENREAAKSRDSDDRVLLSSLKPLEIDG